MRHYLFPSPSATRTRSLLTFVFVAAMIAACGRVLRGQGPDPDVAPVRAEVAAQMKQITECLSAFRGDGAGRRPLPLRREPLLRWSDPTRTIRESAIWAWGDRGRPCALVTMELSADHDRDEDALKWGFEFILLKDETVVVDGSNEIRASRATNAGHSKPVLSGPIHWAPERPGLTFRDVPGAPLPARTAQTRLLQMKELIRRFSAVAHPSRQPDRLRLVSHPIDRYADAEAEQIDGAIFFFSIGTNPEVMVLLEAQGPTLDRSSWRYAVAPVTVAPFEVDIDRKQVWAQPYHSEPDNKPTGSYFTVRMPRLRP